MQPITPSPSEIRKAREDAGLTQAEAATLLGVTRVAWARYEAATARNKRTMTPSMWAHWLHVAGLERIPFRKRVI